MAPVDPRVLPQEVRSHLPSGLERPVGSGHWLVMPLLKTTRDGISEVNAWLRLEDWYPLAFADIVWFGDDGVGNFVGWDPSQNCALLWNPEDGNEAWRKGTIEEIWRFIERGYKDHI